jgi:hypothetical protein
VVAATENFSLIQRPFFGGFFGTAGFFEFFARNLAAR